MRLLSLSLLSVLLLCGTSSAADLPEPEKLPASKGFPDPLVMRDGTPVRTPKEWNEKRRPELKELIQHYMYGKLPAPVKVTAKVDHEDKKAFDGKATLREISLTLHPKAPPIRLLLVVPNSRPAPVGVFVGMNFTGNHTLVDDPAVRIPTSWMYP